ncbi:MAG: site-specific integrase [Pseudomonadota bacterium]
MKVIFTDANIRNLPTANKVYDCSADKEPGFGIRVHPGGTMAFYFLYKIDGKKKFLNLGHYPATTLKLARELYHAELSKVKALRRGSADGVDPVAKIKRDKQLRIEETAARSKADTVADLIKEYIEKHAKPTKRSWYEDERILNKDALVAWGKRKALDIKKRDVVLLLESIIERGSPGSANNNFKIIRKMFRFAVQRDILEYSPCDGVVMPAPLNRGDRVLSESEIKTLWYSLDTCHVSHEIRSAIRLILLTGQRPGEVIGMHRSEIDDRWWTIPAERSKNKKAHRVYLTNTALELIGSLKVTDPKTGEVKDRGVIFPCPKKPKKNELTENELTEKERPMGRLSISQVVSRNLSFPVQVNGKPVFSKNGEPVTENLLGVSAFTPHDLRRTAATFMSQIGFMDEIIDAVLNHTKQGIIRTYNLNRYDKEKQQALEAWGRKLLSIVTESQKKDNIVSITRMAA